MPILEELPQSDILPRGSWTTELPEVKDPSAGEVISAAFANENEVVAGINALMRARNFKPIEGYSAFSDPASDARLLDQYPDHFKGIRSPDERSARESTIRREEANAEVIQSAGWAGTFAAVGAGLASPTMFLPGGAVYKAGRLGYRVGRTAASVAPAAAGATALQEGALHSFTHTRTAAQSAVAIGGSAVFGGLVGAGVAGAARISRGEWEALLRGRQREAAEAGGYPLKPMTGEARYAEREVTSHVGPDDGADVLPDADVLRDANPVGDPAPIVTRAPDGEIAPTIKADEALGDTSPIVTRDIGKLVDDAAPTAEPVKIASGPEPARYSQREVRRYVALTDGSDEFGYITSDIARAVGVEAAPIRLPEGVHDPITDRGFGEVHIQAGHGTELSKAGYDDVAQFTLDVVRGFDLIYEGSGRSLLLVKQSGRDQIAAIDLRPFGTKGDVNWEVATAAIYRPDFFKNKKLLWSGPGPVNSPLTADLPYGPRSQSHLNIPETGQDFNPARAVEVPPGSVEDAAVAGTTRNVSRQPSNDVSASESRALVPWQGPVTLDRLTTKSPAQLLADAQTTEKGTWAVYFFDDGTKRQYIDKPDATLGRPGTPHFSMPLEDSAVIVDAASAHKYTGGAPSLEIAYKTRGPVWAVMYPLKGLPTRLPTAADTDLEHFLKGGQTALRLHDGRGYMINPTREFVVPGIPEGRPMPNRSVMFEVGRLHKAARRW